MHTYTFRGKRADTGEWVYWKEMGQLSSPCHSQLINGDIGYSHRAHKHISIEKQTISLGARLKDRNGKQIFEGDIVYSIHTKKLYAICFGEYTYTNIYGDEESACGWYGNELDYDYYIAIGKTEDWAVVVGNIHDNPELLKTED